MTFRAITHPVFPGEWQVVDQDGRVHGGGQLIPCALYARELEARASEVMR